MTEINKTLSSDKLRVINKALRKKYPEKYLSVYQIDEDKKEAYGDSWIDDSYVDFKVSYTLNFDNTQAEIIGDIVEVVEQTSFVEVKQSTIEGWLSKALEKYFGGSKDNKQSPVIIKQFEEDEMIEISQMYVTPLDVDAHGDTMEYEEVVKMVANANTKIAKGTLKANYDHKKDGSTYSSTDDFKFIKAFVAECDMNIGGNLVKEGTPLIKVKYLNKEAWEDRKSGGKTGWSIGGRAGSYEWVEIEVDE